MKKILKGASRLQLFPLTANDATNYTPGPAVSVPGLQSLGMEPDVSEWKVNADDQVYEAGADWNGMKLSIQVAELSLELKKLVEGGEYDESTKEYTYSSTSSAPEVGMSFAALTSDKQHRMIKVFAVKFTKVKIDYKTKGDGDSSSPVTIEGTVTQRAKDGAVKREKDTVTPADLAWLDTLVETP